MSGFPIRTPWDHSLVDSSPRPIAASHVLHRLLVPRHPTFGLDNLTTENKMLASTVQFSTNDQPTTIPPTPTRKPRTVCRPDCAWHRNNNLTAQCRLSVVPSGPNRGLCLFAHPSRIPRTFSLPADTKRQLAVLTPKNRCRFGLASVSASEHPTTTFGWRGPLSAF